ncbi:MAG: hypothetical protein HY741_13995 [Chloroflexi bacterium]|nr:hypothetical protein [Chloroflexota bacterium]
MLLFRIIRRAWLVAFVITTAACANTPSWREQAALPSAPTYPPTQTPAPFTATPIPLTPTPTSDAIAPSQNATSPSPTHTPIAPHNPTRDPAALNEYQRGIAYVAVKRNEYRSENSQRALDELFATGANYISVLVTWYQADIHSTAIARAANTPSDEELAFVVQYAHAHGVKVLLKPQVDLTHDRKHWRGEIQFYNEADWQAWFAAYRQFILYHARFAQAQGVEELAVGTELHATTTRTADWRAVIRAVRQEYTGLLTYSANHSGEEIQVQFWDDLDFIGVNVFYHLTNYRTPTMQQILEGWRTPVRQLTNLHNNFPNQPIIFTEVGYPSMDLASVWPWNWDRTGAVDLEEQALLYDGLFQTWWRHPERPWFRGMFIWNWLADPNQGGPDDTDFTPHAKPAEEILRRYYQIPDLTNFQTTAPK